MLLFEKRQEAEAEAEPADGWQRAFRKSLVEKCHAFIGKHPPEQRSAHKPKLWYNFESTKFTEERSFSFESKGQGIYSEFIPVRSNQCHSNELTEYFPYLKLNCEKAEYEVSVFSISESIEGGGDYAKWMQVCKEYLSDLTVEEMFDYYLLMVAKGTSFLNKVRAERDPRCREFPFFAKILEVRRFFGSQEVRINPHISISLDQGEPINLENLSKTMKQLFCPICLIYDCQTHLLSASALHNHFQYVRRFDPAQRSEERKRTALRLFKQLFVIFERQPAEARFCSWSCYKRLDEEKWERLKGKRERRFFSPIFEGLIKMGVELFSYDPCRIQALFCSIDDPAACKTGFEANCEIVFAYLLQEFNLLQKMSFKFYQSEAEQLAKEALASSAGELTPKKAMRPKQGKFRGRDSEDSFNSVCHHYFLDKEPTDVNCLGCECQGRGYCLPSCACSERCEMRLRGCRCKGESSCWDNKCQCFKNGMLCLPGVCEHCEKCGEADGKANWCQNNQRALHRCKQTRIGRSGIENAGLGLFAQEFMRKGEFVIKYLGEVVSSISLEKLRESLVENNLFYTFKLNKYESVDSRVFGNKARFINHSKRKENIVPRAVSLDEQSVIVFHALKDIQKGEELLFNYNGEGELSDFREKFPFIE